MGISGSEECIWEAVKGNNSMYACIIDENDETNDIEVTKRIFYIAHTNKPSLSSIIHEINECEVVEILSKIMSEISLKFEEAYFTTTVEMAARTPWIWLVKPSHFKAEEHILVSHLISPYGCCYCAMPRSKNHLRW